MAEKYLKIRIKKFFEFVKKTDNCWEWLGHKSFGGYGAFWFNDRIVGAHRFSYELHNKKIPKGAGYHGICVLHRCDNPSCVNPEHLFLGTQKENLRDMIKKNRRKYTGMQGGKNGRAKLTQKQVEEIRKLYATGGFLQIELAKRFFVTGENIRKIVHNLRWKSYECFVAPRKALSNY